MYPKIDPTWVWIQGPVADRLLIDFGVPRWVQDQSEMDFWSPWMGIHFSPIRLCLRGSNSFCEKGPGWMAPRVPREFGFLGVPQGSSGNAGGDGSAGSSGICVPRGSSFLFKKLPKFFQCPKFPQIAKFIKLTKSTLN